LDSLPLPAYDLVNLADYGRGSSNHADLVSIEHSRGCVDSCSFCILWKHMGESINGNGTVRPRWRTKSPQRSFEEVRWLYARFGRRTFGWVDPTFNVSPRWANEWAELMLKSDLVDSRGRPRTLHIAWMRADGVVRDESLGILEKLVRAGLRQVMIGVERTDPTGIAACNKHNNDLETCRKAFAIFRERYPQVYTIGTVIFGLPGDTWSDLRRLADCREQLGMDYCFLMPLTPNPGSAATEAAYRQDLIADQNLRAYNFHTPICATNDLSVRELESIYWRILTRPSLKRFAGMLRRTCLERDPRKRRIHCSLLKRGSSIAVSSLWRAIRHPRDPQPANYGRKPSWYDS
jgi:radical SAM superfamily enzyme YgiQ (UPF0313 family)